MRHPRWPRDFDVAEWLRDLADRLERPDEPTAVVAGWVYEIIDGVEADMGEITVQTGAPAQTATVQFLDADGNPVPPDATPSWMSTDEAVATVAASGDGLTAQVNFVGPGSAIIECSTVETADDGTETTVRATGMVNVDSPDVDAVTGEITFSENVATQLPAEGEAPLSPQEGG